jgi:hypothetical protein
MHYHRLGSYLFKTIQILCKLKSKICIFFYFFHALKSLEKYFLYFLVVSENSLKSGVIKATRRRLRVKEHIGCNDQFNICPQWDPK